MTSETPAATVQGLGAFGGALHDFILCDATRSRLFGAVGRAHGPFRGLADWPELHSHVREQSAALLARAGEEAWLRAGGVMDAEGRPTFRQAGGGGADAIRAAAEGPGGFRWEDSLGVVWPVRLVPAAGEGPHAYWGLSFSWQVAARLFRSGPPPRQGEGAAIAERLAASTPEPASPDLARAAQALRLFERGEQLLWATHAAVLRQRCSLVRLPDVWLGQLVWGARKEAWPHRWRQDLIASLASLQALRLAVLRIPRSGWLPQFGALSVPVAYVEDLRVTRPDRDVCAPGCPLYDADVRHGHFLIGVGYGFLGALELFATRDDGQGVREFDFVHAPEGKGRDVAAARKAGRLVSVHLPTKLLGPAAGVGPTSRRILDALVREVTRVPRGKKSDRPDRAGLVAAGPGAAAEAGLQRSWGLPPGLWASFNGNGVRAGRGYRLAGAKGTGWLDKAGFACSGESRRQAARAFLKELAGMTGPFGLVAQGFDPRGGPPLDLDSLVRLANVAVGWERLERLRIRVHGPADYPDRWRRLLAERAGFAAVPKATGADADAALARAEGTRDAGLSLWVEMGRRNLTRRKLAERLGVSPSFVSQLYRGKKNWPEGLLAKAWGVVTGGPGGGQGGTTPARSPG